jgi:hypothetical protein
MNKKYFLCMDYLKQMTQNFLLRALKILGVADAGHRRARWKLLESRAESSPVTRGPTTTYDLIFLHSR